MLIFYDNDWIGFIVGILIAAWLFWQIFISININTYTLIKNPIALENNLYEYTVSKKIMKEKMKVSDDALDRFLWK